MWLLMILAHIIVDVVVMGRARLYEVTRSVPVHFVILVSTSAPG
jgi:hypothetical protein